MESDGKSHDQERPLDGGVVPYTDWWKVAESRPGFFNRSDVMSPEEAERKLLKLRPDLEPQGSIVPVVQVSPELNPEE